MAGPANTQFSVAAHVLVYLAGMGGRPISSDELSGSVNVNPVHIRRVMGPLRAAGMVRSRVGVGGGWELARPAESIRLDEVWELVHSAPAVASHGPQPNCPVGRHVGTVIGELQDDVAAAIAAALHEHTVAEIVEGIAVPTA